MFIRGKLERNKGLLNFKKTSIEQTALHPWLKDISPEGNLVFKESKLRRIALFLFGFTLVFIAIVAFFQGADAYVLSFGLLGLFLIIISWFFQTNFVLELTSTGIRYNHDFYEWQSIVSTLILADPVNNHYRYYVILALTNGNILSLEITDTFLENERAMGLSQFKIPEDRLISHFVECFKQLS